MPLDLLLVDDEPSIRLAVGDALKAAGHRVRTASDGAEAQAILQSGAAFDVVITDIRMPKVGGLDLFRKIHAEQPRTDVILITAYGSVDDAVQALKDGASDFVTKPFETDELLHRLARVERERTLAGDLSRAREELALVGKAAIVGRSPTMARLLDRVVTFAASDAPVMITGESGTGKELIARTLHDRSPRAAKPFVAVNCAAFPETLIEAELFGHERGAFTGAVRKREGRFKSAHGGTLLLDEVAEIPLPVQAKLLRVLQEGAFEPLGTNQQIHVDVRVVSATHRNLKEWIAAGKFREDLYYRLNVLSVDIPPLRERAGDLPLLAQHFLQKYAPSGKKPTITPRAWAALQEYRFPGNVRELEHAIQHAVVLSHGEDVDLEHLPADVAGKSAGAAEPAKPATLRPLAEAVKEFEREYILRALRATSGKRAEAAELLGISRKNLWEKMRAHGLAASDATEE